MSSTGTRTRTRMAVAIALVSLLSAATAAPAAAATIRWAWVVARNPTLGGYTPAAMDQGNSLSGTNLIVRSGAGEYEVFFDDMDGGGGGMVHVSPLGGVSRYCSVEGWGAVTGGVEASVRCFEVGGSRADTKFVAAYQDTNSNEGKAAYAWADDAAATEPYEPAPAFSYNSVGGDNAAWRFALGRYVVRFGELGSPRGNVQVTTYGDDHIACRAAQWAEDFGAAQVLIKCRDEAGLPVDNRFNVTFTQGQGLKGVSGDKSAYLWANQPTTASYHPPSNYRWSSVGGVATVTRTSTGRYTVELPGMPRGGAALVTPTGGGKQRCQVGTIRTDAAPQVLTVRCFNLIGNPADAAFSLQYLK